MKKYIFLIVLFISSCATPTQLINRALKKDPEILRSRTSAEVIYVTESLERGWNNNERMISCVPKGRYTIKLEWSNRFGANLWELKNVPNRSECKLHSANYWNQLNGCIALGLSLRDINGDGEVDATSSRRAMKDFSKAMGNALEAEIIIR